MSARVRALLLVAGVLLVAAMWVVSITSKRIEAVSAGSAGLEPRRFETLTVIAAGTGGTFENHLRLGPCIVVGLADDVVMVDAGRAVAQALRRATLPAEQPALVLTSLLPENTLGLDDWLWAVELAGAHRVVIGPRGTRALVDGLRAAHAAGARAGAAAFGVDADATQLEVIEAGEGFTRQLGGLALRAAEQRGAPLPTLAWRIEAAEKSVVVSGAGSDPDALVRLAQGADLWVHEALRGASLEQAVAARVPHADELAREAALHTRLEDVGALATRAGVRRLALVRLRPPPVYGFQYVRLVAPTFAGAVIVPDDGDEITP